MTRRLPGGIRLSTLAMVVAGLVLAVVAVTVLTAGLPSGPVAAAPFTVSELGHPGQQVSLSQYAGRPVVINFFASWCAPCRQETPLLARFFRDHHGRVLIIGIDGQDQATAALAFLHARGVTYPVGTDPALNLASTYGVGAGFPQTFFLDARHQIVRHVIGVVSMRDLTSWAASIGAGQQGAS